MGSLNGRVVMVTGGAGGIGSAIARTVVKAGGQVVIHDIDEDAASALARELGPAAGAIAAELSRPEEVDRLWHDAQRVHGDIDVLVNNAGAVSSLSLEANLDDWVGAWNHVLSVNLVAASILCRNAVRTFTARSQDGIIINVSSLTAHRGAAEDNWHYGATKGGLLALTRTIARHYGRRGVTAFAVAPGFVVTPMSKEHLEREGHEKVAEVTALGQLAQPQDVANVVGFLATGLAQHSTGSTIDVNSGSYLR